MEMNMLVDVSVVLEGAVVVWSHIDSVISLLIHIDFVIDDEESFGKVRNVFLVLFVGLGNFV